MKKAYIQYTDTIGDGRKNVISKVLDENLSIKDRNTILRKYKMEYGSDSTLRLIKGYLENEGRL